MRTLTRAVPASLAIALLTARPAAAHTDAPAGGVPTEDLIPAGIAGALLVLAVALFGWAHRSHRTGILIRGARLAERASGLPGWVALPAALVGLSLLVAVFGFYWDVATHIDNGRDPGPFANPSHWLIILGLLGIALGGVSALLLGVDDDTPTGVRLRDGWRVPIGGVLLTICGVIALAGFPLDDVWHRIFGQDVTLWSPTHIQMVGGASLSTLCLWILVEEGRRAQEAAQGRSRERAPRLLDAVIAGAFLVGASTLQAEFDYAVPQFRLLYHPVLLMTAAGIALVPARLRLGRGGALRAVAVFLVIRGLLTLLVTPVMGRTLLHFPLYLASAVAVELIALRVPATRPIRLGAWAGVAVGTLGLAGEWAWSHVWLPIAWPAGMLGEAVAVALPAAVAAGAVGGFLGRALTPQPHERVRTWVPVATGVVMVGALVYPIPMADVPGARVHASLEEVDSQPRRVQATITVQPREIAEGAEYVNVTAWQGAQWRHGVHSFADPLERVGDGVFRTTRPIPVDGLWKALVRVHNGRTMIAAPLYLPADAAIPAEEVPAERELTRDFVLGQRLLLREARETPAWLTVVAYALTLAILVVWVASVGWGVRHLRRSAAEPASGRPVTRTAA